MKEKVKKIVLIYWFLNASISQKEAKSKSILRRSQNPITLLSNNVKSVIIIIDNF